MLSPADADLFLQSLRSKGYVIDGGNFPTSRRGRVTVALITRTGIPVVAKLYPSGGGEIAYANMQELWRSSFGERRQPPGLPRPIDYLPDIGALIMERIEGRPFVELGTLDEDILDGSIRLVASLHECDAQPSKRRDSRRIVLSARRKAERIAELAPKFAKSIWAVVEALKAAQVEDLELVPCHGDFSPRNVLVATNGLVLIDWDRFRRADPARDVAYMGTWWWVWALRQKRLPNWFALDRVVDMYNSLRPETCVKERLDFYVAAGLVRMSLSLVELWREDTDLLPQLATEALRRLR